MKRRSAEARDLRTPKYRPRVVKSKKVYSRKRKLRNLSADEARLGGLRYLLAHPGWHN